MGDTHRGLAQAAHRFFIQWHELLVSLFEKAKGQGTLKRDVDSHALSKLVMSTVEGAILICKASKDRESLKTTTETLKWMIRGLMCEGRLQDHGSS